jgi:hypothetical protein
MLPTFTGFSHGVTQDSEEEKSNVPANVAKY